MKEKLLRLPEVLRRTGFGRSHIYNLINQGEFPKQIQISSGAVAWLESEFEAWMEKKFRNQGTTPPGGRPDPPGHLRGTPSAVFIRRRLTEFLILTDLLDC